MPNLFAEITSIQQKLAQGAEELRKLNDIVIGNTPKTILHQLDGVTLYRYDSNNHSPPLLIVFALVNRPSILDLTADCSVIQNLLQAGHDVYLIDWGYPNAADEKLTLTDYVNHYLKSCVNFLIQNTSYAKINIMGICQGGVLALCYSCLYPQQINAIITAVTPIDFHTPDNILSQLVRKVNIDNLVKFSGNIPGLWIQQMFLALNPFRLIGKKYFDFVEKLDDPLAIKRFLSIEKWLYDTPNLAAAAFSEFVKNFYQHNKLIKGEIVINKQQINLAHIKQPILNIIANNDQIIPPSASVVLAKYIGSKNYTCHNFNSGHIGIFISDKIQKQLCSTIGDWLNKI